MSKDKYGFGTTSLTLVEKLSRGEDWERFCLMYHAPIRKRFIAVNASRGFEIKAGDVDDAISALFLKLNREFQGKGKTGGKVKGYNHKEKRLHDWLYMKISSAIHDYYNSIAKYPIQPTLDTPNEDGETMDVLGSESLWYDLGCDQWIKYLQETAVTLAYERRAWTKQTKQIINALLQEARKKKPRRASEIAKEFSTTPENVRKIRERFYAEVRKRFNQFKMDDPDFFDEWVKSGKFRENIEDVMTAKWVCNGSQNVNSENGSPVLSVIR